MFHLFWVLQCDSVHFHVDIVLLPSHVVQLALRTCTVDGHHWSAEFGFHLADHAPVGGLDHFAGDGVLQFGEEPVLQGLVELLGVGTVVGPDGGVDGLVLGWPDDRVTVVVEPGGHVAVHAVQNDRVVALFSVAHVGLEGAGGDDAVELVLGEHGVLLRADVHELQVSVVEVFHRVVVKAHVTVSRELDGVLGDEQRAVQVAVAVAGDVVVQRDLLQGGDFLHHVLHQSVDRGQVTSVLVLVLLLLLDAQVVGVAELVVLAVLHVLSAVLVVTGGAGHVEPGVVAAHHVFVAVTELVLNGQSIAVGNNRVQVVIAVVEDCLNVT